MVSILSIILTLVAVGVIYIVADTHNRIQVKTGKSYTSEEVKALIEEAKEEGIDQGKISVLANLKGSLEDGSSVIAVLKSFYPDYIVVAANNRYNFVEIDDSLAKNEYKVEKEYSNANENYIHYQSGEKQIIFTQSEINDYNKNFNTEGQQIDNLQINGYDAIGYFDNHGMYSIVWNNGEYIFDLNSNIGKDALIEMAESVQKVE